MRRMSDAGAHIWVWTRVMAMRIGGGTPRQRRRPHSPSLALGKSLPCPAKLSYAATVRPSVHPFPPLGQPTPRKPQHVDSVRPHQAVQRTFC